MHRSTPLGTAALLVALLTLSLASGQDGNPFARRRAPAKRDPSLPAWAGAFTDESGTLALILGPTGKARFEGVLVDQEAQELLEVEGEVGEGVLGGRVTRGEERYPFSARVDGDALVITSGQTTTRWTRAPGDAQAGEALRNLREARLHGNEAAAIGALKTINTAQVVFREGDKDGNGELDYGTLAQLAHARLIDEALGSGTKQGYRFEALPSPTTPEFLWMATATPVEPGRTGTRHFVTNHSGVIYYSTRAPFTLNPDCKIPEHATPVGREERGRPIVELIEEEELTTGKPARAQRPDLSHVRVGQVYRYVLTNPGAPPMEMHYQVREVEGLTVRYDISTLLDMGKGLEKVGPPTPQEWRFEPALFQEPPGQAAERVEITREQVRISGITFDCMVIVSGNSKSWVPATGDVPTFPGLVRAQVDGKTIMELVAIE
ncbi:MAG: hypothetical protein KF878_05735 [Planctomycetes bacterium]|nr:hypothetical protein [Planctomycetota bacterium]